VNAPSLVAGYPHIAPHELARVVLRESGQGDRDAVNPAQILEDLQLDHLSADLEREFSQELRNRASPDKPIAVLSVPDRIIATDPSLSDTAARFAVLHEIAHYLLPHHRHSLYLCGTHGMSASTRLILEREANSLAADLLFQGDRFALDASSHAPTAASMRLLAHKYRASTQLTVRRMVQCSGMACMLAILTREPGSPALDPDALPSWHVTDCVASAAFAARHFARLTGPIPHAIAQRVAAMGDDHGTSVIDDLHISQGLHATAVADAASGAARDAGTSPRVHFRCELFRDGDQLLAILTPPTPHRRYHRSR
jgi:hypothetical protein